jgi:hypothetical protein
MIPGGARLKLEAKVNLGNYESLGVQVEADCRTSEDVDELRAMLDAELAKFGRDDLEIGARIDAWRHRVIGGGPALEQSPSGIRETPAPPIAVPGMAEPVKVSKVSAKKDLHVPSSAAADPDPADEEPEPEPTDEELAAMAPEPVAKTPAPAKATPEKKAAAKPAGTPSGVNCEDCGAEVTKAELTTSRLFISKAICTACLKTRNAAVPGERV